LRPIRIALIAFLLVATCITGSVMAAPTLEAVKSRGHLRCGVHSGLPGFASPDQKGNWKGMDVDVCRAVAAAVLGDAGKVRFTPLSAKERLTALQSGA